MKTSLCLLLCFTQFFLLPHAYGANVLQFAAKIQDEELAEEAITLLHCLAERSDAHWEFTGEAAGDHWLKLEESQKRIRGFYFRNGNKSAVDLTVGEAEETCAKFYSARAPEISSSAPTDLDTPTLPALTDSAKPSYWPWAIAFGTAALAGFIIWKANRTDHSALRMN